MPYLANIATSGELVDRRRAFSLEAAAAHLAKRPPLVTAAPVGMAVSERIIWIRITPPLLWRIGRCLGGVLQASITINLFPGDYTAASRLIWSRVTWSQAGID